MLEIGLDDGERKEATKVKMFLLPIKFGGGGGAREQTDFSQK